MIDNNFIIAIVICSVFFLFIVIMIIFRILHFYKQIPPIVDIKEPVPGTPGQQTLYDRAQLYRSRSGSKRNLYRSQRSSEEVSNTRTASNASVVTNVLQDSNNV
jgi:hypothetical protein